MVVKGAIFDMDGTLVDSLGIWDVIWERLGERFAGDKDFRPDAVTEKAIRTSTLFDGMVLLHEKCGIGRDGMELYTVANSICENFYIEEVELKDGVREFLDHCLEKGVKMCVASATARPLIDIVMKKFELDRYFPKIFSCAEIEKGKEHPDIFIKAHEYLGTPKESTWIFEDSIVSLETATRAGYKTVGVYDKYNFNLDKVEQISTEYIGEGDSLARLNALI